MSLYLENDSFKLSKAERVGSLGETEVTNSELGFILNSKDFKDIEEEHNIGITKEVDRLVFTGKFKRGTDVNVILYKNGTKNIYNVSISKRPYTALCVDIFTEEETKEEVPWQEKRIEIVKKDSKVNDIFFMIVISPFNRL